MVAVMVSYVLRKNQVLHVPNSLIQENLFHIKHIKAFATLPMVKINQRRNVDMPTMRILQNSDVFLYIVQLFTRGETKVDSFKIAVADYCNANHVKIDQP